MKLSVVIVNYNVKYFLEQCLRSACKAACNIPSCEIIVVDNASTDGSVEYLSERFPNVTIIASKENLGFARGNNLAIRQSKGEYVLLLNPDTIVAENTFADFVAFMDSNPDAGACGAYMMHADGAFALESRRGLPTPFVAFCKMSGLTSLFPESRLFGRYYMRYLNKHEINRIEIISGAYMFLRRGALDAAGLLDEDFFMYGEDIDLSYRILRTGYKNFFLPSAILHYKGESTDKSSYRYTHTFYKAMQLFFRKHYSHYSFIVSIPISLAIWGRALFAYIGNMLRHRKVMKCVQLSCIVIGRPDMLDEVRDILEPRYGKGKHLFMQGGESVLPYGHFSANVDFSKYNTVVYDSGAYSFAAILELMQKSAGNGLRLGTYSTDTKILITDNSVHEWRKQ